MRFFLNPLSFIKCRYCAEVAIVCIEPQNSVVAAINPVQHVYGI